MPKEQDTPLTTDSWNLIKLIERLAFRTWPAEETIECGDFVFRASQGITKRANSVWTSTGSPFPESNWLEQAKHFYELHSLPLLFHISNVSPPGLDKQLADAGYIVEAPCSVLTGETAIVIANTPDRDSSDDEWEITVTPHANSAWIDEFLLAEQFDASKRAFYEKVLNRIQPLKGFFSFKINGQCAAVATVVLEEGWAGITNVAVVPERRGQGIGRVLLHELALWCKDQGAHHLYLQVVQDNIPAWRLYTKAGFTPLYEYHYRREPLQS